MLAIRSEVEHGRGIRHKARNAAKGGITAIIEEAGRLDAYTKLTSLLLAGVGVEVIRGALLEFCAAAQFGAKVNAESSDGHANGEPANDLKGFGLAFFFTLAIFGGH
ncbi:MAG TPA: hypothetical protein VH308_13765 [Terracidiphilus sp.]|nr:hypothetical protein [Terracidiphilus sp.]